VKEIHESFQGVYSYFVLVRRRDKTDESRRSIVSRWFDGMEEEEGNKEDEREVLIYLEGSLHSQKWRLWLCVYVFRYGPRDERSICLFWEGRRLFSILYHM
jgi:hypothetical protein